MGCIECLCERIGHHFRRAAVVMLIVQLLDTAPAGYIILIGCKLQLAVIGKVYHALHKTFTVCFGAHDDGTVEVLQRTARNFRGRSRTVIHENHNGHQRIDGFNLRKIVAVNTLHLAAVAHNQLAFRHKTVHNINSFLLRSASISTQIKHQSLHPLALHLNDCVPNDLATTLSKRVQIEVAYTVFLQSIIGHCGQLYGTSRNFEFHILAC